MTGITKIRRSLILLTELFLFCLMHNSCSTESVLSRDEFITLSEKKEGAKVSIVKLNYDEIIGELLSIGDSTILIINSLGLSDSEIAVSIDKIISINIKNIRMIRHIGVNNIIELTVAGTLVGGATGYLVGLADGDGSGAGKEGFLQFSSGEKACMGSCLFGAGGAIIGLLSGIITTTPDKIAYEKDLNKFNITELRVIARYKDKEPDFIKAIK